MRIVTSLFLLLTLSVPALASMGNDGVEIVFSQEMVAFDSSGAAYEPTIIDPTALSGVTSHDFDLQRGRSLRVISNLSFAREQDLVRVAPNCKAQL